MPAKKTTTTREPASRVLEITRIFDAPRARVFAAWTRPEHIRQWLAPKDFTILSAMGDLREGGAWSECMVHPSGERFPVSGVYRKIVPDELLEFTHAWIEDDGTRGHETVITVRLTDYGKKTKMTFRQAVFATKESRDRHAGGWGQCFDKLAPYLKRTPAMRRK